MNESVSDRIEGREHLRQVVCDLVAQAAADGAHRMVWVDRDFGDWPLDEAAVLGALTRWARPGRSLQLLANDWRPVGQAHPRFVRWRQQFAHLVSAAQMHDDAPPLPTVLLADLGQGLVINDDERFIGVRLTQGRAWLDQRERVDVWLQQSEPAFSPTTLGL